MNESQLKYQEFSLRYLPDLSNYVVPIHVGDDQIGSGVLVNWCGRHIIATARHCIENQPRAFVPSTRIEQDMQMSTRQIQILQAKSHETLDVGYLEIEDPRTGEIDGSQFHLDRVEDGMVHIIGYPESLAFVDWPKKKFSVCGGAFSTSIVEVADDFMKLDYPEQGWKVEKDEWVPSRFPDTPRGFSGGGCFAVECRTAGALQIVEYKLLGIQYSWSKNGRWVKVIPIRHLCELLSQ